MQTEIAETYRVERTDQAVALLNPLRAEILAHMREPVSATEVAKAMNDTPQRINYHLKALEKAELIRKCGTRQVRNLVEVLYQAIAKTFVLTEAIGGSPEQARHMKDQSALSHLITAAEQMKRDALRLLEISDGKHEVPSATLQTAVNLPSEKDRNAFIREYAALVRKLAEKYHSDANDASTYQLQLAVYPEPEEGGKQT